VESSHSDALADEERRRRVHDLPRRG
jgi:hypothetical protein